MCSGAAEEETDAADGTCDFEAVGCSVKAMPLEAGRMADTRAGEQVETEAASKGDATTFALPFCAATELCARYASPKAAEERPNSTHTCSRSVTIDEA